MFYDEFGVDLAERQGPQWSGLSHLTRQIEFLGEDGTSARGKAEAEERCHGKHMLRAAPSIRVMLANMQVALMITQRIDDIERLLVRLDDLRRWSSIPLITRAPGGLPPHHSFFMWIKATHPAEWAKMSQLSYESGATLASMARIWAASQSPR